MIEVSELHPENARSGRCVIPSGSLNIALPSAAMVTRPRGGAGSSHNLLIERPKPGCSCRWIWRSLNEAITTGPLPTKPPSSANSRSMRSHVRRLS